MKKLLMSVIIGALLCISVPMYAKPAVSKQERFKVLQKQMDYLQVSFFELAETSKVNPDDSTLKWRLIFTKAAYDQIKPELDTLTDELACSLVFNQCDVN